MKTQSISSRAYSQMTSTHSWEEIWEAGPYYDRISELLEDAQSYAIFAGWQIDSRIRLKKPSRPPFQDESTPHEYETLLEKVVRICNSKPNFRIYFILWDHAYFYVFEREAWQGRIWDNLHPRIHFIFDNRHVIGGSHHEKIAIFDGKIALNGGIDLCDERWDDPQHLHSNPRRSIDWKKEHHGPYHDLAVQVSGQACKIIHMHLAQRWCKLSTIPFPFPETDSSFYSGQTNPFQPQLGQTVYISKTLASIDQIPKEYASSPFYSNAIIREIEFLFRDLIFSAKKRIILEGQYYWSRVLNDILISKIVQMKNTDFEVILILSELKNIKSFTRKMMPYELFLLKRLETAAHQSKIRFIMASPYVSAPTCSKTDQAAQPPKPIYIHSKVLIIDDRFLSIGSANFTERALRIDTELQLTFEAKNEIERLHIQKFANLILRHWGITRKQSEIYLRPFLPAIEQNYTHLCLEGNRIFSWEHIFDPPLPWLFPLQMRFRKLYRKRLTIFHFLFLTLGVVSTFSLYLTHTTPYSQIYYLFILSSVWLVPIPFFILSLIASFHYGPDYAIKFGVYSIWIASTIGYLLVRTFPELAKSIFPLAAPSWFLNGLGKRNFQILLSLLVDPRANLQTKIIYQSFAFIPLPWFVLGTFILLPSVFYLEIYIMRFILGWIIPSNYLQLTQEQVKLFFLFAFFFTIQKVVLNLWKHST